MADEKPVAPPWRANWALEGDAHPSVLLEAVAEMRAELRDLLQWRCDFAESRTLHDVHLLLVSLEAAMRPDGDSRCQLKLEPRRTGKKGPQTGKSRARIRQLDRAVAEVRRLEKEGSQTTYAVEDASKLSGVSKGEIWKWLEVNERVLAWLETQNSGD